MGSSLSGRPSLLAALSRNATRIRCASHDIARTRDPLQTLEGCVTPTERSIESEVLITGRSRCDRLLSSRDGSRRAAHRAIRARAIPKRRGPRQGSSAHQICVRRWWVVGGCPSGFWTCTYIASTAMGVCPQKPGSERVPAAVAGDTPSHTALGHADLRGLEESQNERIRGSSRGDRGLRAVHPVVHSHLRLRD